MGQVFWIFISAATIGGVIGLTALGNQQPETVQTTVSAPVRASAPEVANQGTAGSALATAAFGLSALQPETYNGELVLEIIDASHLNDDEKRELVSDLAAAEAGRADLDDVLEEVRVALAVE